MSAVSPTVSKGGSAGSPAIGPLPSSSLGSAASATSHNLVVNAKPIAMELFIIGDNGNRYRIHLTAQQQAEYERICESLNPSGAADFFFDAQKLIVRANGTETRYPSNHPAVIAYREFVHANWQNNFGWETHIEGHRTTSSAPPSFVQTSGRLKALQFSPREVATTLQRKATQNDKIAYLKKDRAVRRLISASRTILDERNNAIAPGTLQAQGRKQAILGAKELLSDSLEATLAFEAAHPLGNIPTTAELLHKKEVAKQWIGQTKTPPSGMMDRVTSMFKSDRNLDEEAAYAEDLARLGCAGKNEYDLLGAEERAEGPAFFYARLAEAIATNQQTGTLIDGPLFELAFGGLNTEDKQTVKDRLRNETNRLAAAINQTASAQPLQMNLVDEALLEQFDQTLAETLQPNP